MITRQVIAAVVLFGMSLAQTARGDTTAIFGISWNDADPNLVVRRYGPVVWGLHLELSGGSPVGLAGFSADFVQDPNNSELFDIPLADPNSIPPSMSGFSRPEGISNAEENGSPSGYFGVQRGTAGEMNLIQLGGMQNTFGYAGTEMGTDTDIDTGIALTPIVVVSGEFDAPTTPGRYVFYVNMKVNAITSLPGPPPTAVVESVLPGASISTSFISCMGDVNEDLSIDLTDMGILLAAYGKCVEDGAQYVPNADIDASGCIDLTDMGILLTNTGLSCQ